MCMQLSMVSPHWQTPSISHWQDPCTPPLTQKSPLYRISVRICTLPSLQEYPPRPQRLPRPPRSQSLKLHCSNSFRTCPAGSTHSTTPLHPASSTHLQEIYSLPKQAGEWDAVATCFFIGGCENNAAFSHFHPAHAHVVDGCG